MSKITLLILCAGFGKRMLNLTLDTPKPLLKYENKVMLGNTINFFRDIGFENIFINTHYLHDKIEVYINNNFNKFGINLIYEPIILGTGGAVKNILKLNKTEKICVVNSDIFWKKENKFDVIQFLQDYKKVDNCKILLSKRDNFMGLKKKEGDFTIHDKLIYHWNFGDEILYYSGLQVVSKKIFSNKKNIFSMTEIWNNLISQKKLMGEVISSRIMHIGDKKSLEEF